MLKLQQPNKLNEYERIEMARVNELHFAGFIPEYLYGVYFYFKKSKELTAFLNGESSVKNEIITTGYLQSDIDEIDTQETIITTNVDNEELVIVQPKKRKKKKEEIVEIEVSEDE